jgi:hypothetical protein
VARGTLDEIMTGLATYRGAEIFPNVDETILAVETRRSWGCAFDFAVYSDGGYAADAMFAVRTQDGEWQDLTDSGVWGDGWKTPWAVPDDRWPDGDRLWVMGRVGMEGNDDGEPVPLFAVYGFATRAVHAIRVEVRHSSRTVTPSACGAFLALEEGRDPVTLVPLGSSGEVIGTAESYEAPV